MRSTVTSRSRALGLLLAVASVVSIATPASANPHDGPRSQNDFRIRELGADLNQTTSTITVSGTMDRSMAGTIVIVRPSFFVDQLCRSRDDPTVTFTAHGEINVFSQWIDFTVDQPSLEQPGKQLDWAAAVEFVNPTDPSQSAGFYSICPAGFIPADLSATRPAFVLTGARLVLWPGPFSPLRDKHGQYIGFLVAQFPVGVTRLNRSEISSYLVLN